MTGFRIIEIAEDGRHLSADRGFLVVSTNGAEIGRVPLDDILAVVASAHGLTYTNNLVVRLAEIGAALVACGANHMPVAWLWPTDGHHVQAGRMRAQIDAALPLRKRLWRDIVRAKILAQGAALAACGAPSDGFLLLARAVRPGDPDNVEARAARRYWPAVFGADFRRDAAGPPPNGLLNYGYAVLRAATARAVAGAGLHPSLGLHHANAGNAFCLVDDLMEPFRPAVDIAVAELARDGRTAVEMATKRVLAAVPAGDLRTRRGKTPLATCIERLAQSLAAALAGETDALDLPLPPGGRSGLAPTPC
jgi:CRISPR-associated protein Cas1